MFKVRLGRRHFTIQHASFEETLTESSKLQFFKNISKSNFYLSSTAFNPCHWTVCVVSWVKLNESLLQGDQLGGRATSNVKNIRKGQR